jgi:glycosyltransferase involved in cell wall biosynthesis
MSAGPTVWFDVEDLLHHFRSGVSRPSGIQRLTFEVYRAAQAAEGAGGRVRFVRHGQAGEPRLVPTRWAPLEAAYRRAQLSTAPAPWRGMAVDGGSSASAGLLGAAAAQAQAIGALARFGVALARYPLRAASCGVRRAARTLARRAPGGELPIAADADGARPAAFEDAARPGDTVLALGSPWFRTDYAGLVRWARDARRLRFGALIYDMVPVNHPEWCDAGVVRTFRAWYESVLPLCDVVFSISRHTADEVERWAAREGIRLAGPVRPVPIGTGFGGEALPAGPRPAGLPPAGSYVVFVSTLEARKNHALLVRVWRELLDEERCGRRPAGSVPTLVFAGRVGWLVGDLLQQLDNASWLEGRVRLVRNPSDAVLRALYEGALFSVFPSWYEGWGLPVTEALGFGVPVLCSSATALPEAGGNLARYFDPGDTGDCRAAVAALIDDRAGLAAWREEVRARFRPVPWSETAQVVLEAARSLG